MYMFQAIDRFPLNPKISSFGTPLLTDAKRHRKLVAHALVKKTDTRSGGFLSPTSMGIDINTHTHTHTQQMSPYSIGGGGMGGGGVYTATFTPCYRVS